MRGAQRSLPPRPVAPRDLERRFALGAARLELDLPEGRLHPGRLHPGQRGAAARRRATGGSELAGRARRHDDRVEVADATTANTHRRWSSPGAARCRRGQPAGACVVVEPRPLRRCLYFCFAEENAKGGFDPPTVFLFVLRQKLRRAVSIRRPLGYGPSTLPLRHFARFYVKTMQPKQYIYNIQPRGVPKLCQRASGGRRQVPVGRRRQSCPIAYCGLLLQRPSVHNNHARRRALAGSARTCGQRWRGGRSSRAARWRPRRGRDASAAGAGARHGGRSRPARHFRNRRDRARAAEHRHASRHAARVVVGLCSSSLGVLSFAFIALLGGKVGLSLVQSMCIVGG